MRRTPYDLPPRHHAISDLVNQHAGFLAKLGALAPSDVLVTSITVRGEVLFGLARLPAGKRKSSLEAQANTVLAKLVCHAPDIVTAEHYARLRVEQERLGRRLEQNDLWIAATAAQLGAIIVSRVTT